MARRFRNIIGPKVRKLRIAGGLTQDQLAARLQMAGLENIDRVAVAKIESQIRSVFDFEAVIIAKALRADIEDLMAVPSKAMETALPQLRVGEAD